MKGLSRLETNFSTQPATAREDPRIPRANADPRRTQRAEAAPSKGATSPDAVNDGGRAYSFPKSLRLLKRAEFRRVYEEGRRESARICTIFFRSNGLPQTRLGITTPSALGGAVSRNRMRRRLREVFRLNQAQIPAGWDIVLNPRPAVAKVRFEALAREMLRLFPAAPPKAAPGQPEARDSRR
jgi:ribonuclease P protein component